MIPEWFRGVVYVHLIEELLVGVICGLGCRGSHCRGEKDVKVGRTGMRNPIMPKRFADGTDVEQIRVEIKDC